MRRRFSIAQILVAVAVVSAVVVAISLLTRSKEPATDPNSVNFASCPSSSPDACADLVAQVWKNDARMPSIAVPSGLRYDRGFVATTGPAAAFYVFQTFVDGSTHPTELTLRVSPATSKPYDVAHRGGKVRHLANGRAYLDFSNAKQSGPFVERLGDVEVVVSWASSAAPTSLKAAQLELFAGVAAR